MSDGINFLFKLAIFGVISIFVFIGYLVYKFIELGNPKPIIIESKTKLTPEIKLHTDGKTIDTIYVYKQKIK